MMEEMSRRALRPGERLQQTIWLRALTFGGRLSHPTIERINALKCLAEKWSAEDRELLQREVAESGE